MVIAFWIVSLTISSVILFIPVVILSFVIYRFTFFNTCSRSDELLPLYLVAVGVQMIHFAEEYLTGFTTALPALIGAKPYPLGYWLAFNMVAYFIFILGGIVIFQKMKELMMIPIFFILAGVVLNGIGHVLLSLYVGGYFPGLYTALIYLVLGPLLMKKLFVLSRVH